MFKKKRKTVFDLPSDKAQESLQRIAENIYAIVDSKEFAEISSKIPIPESATRQDINNMIKQYAPKKVRDILNFVLELNYENIIKIIAEVFCEDYNVYKTKSLNQIAEDVSSLTQSQLRILSSFFIRAGK